MNVWYAGLLLMSLQDDMQIKPVISLIRSMNTGAVCQGTKHLTDHSQLTPRRKSMKVPEQQLSPPNAHLIQDRRPSLLRLSSTSPIHLIPGIPLLLPRPGLPSNSLLGILLSSILSIFITISGCLYRLYSSP